MIVYTFFWFVWNDLSYTVIDRSLFSWKIYFLILLGLQLYSKLMWLTFVPVNI